MAQQKFSCTSFPMQCWYLEISSRGARLMFQEIRGALKNDIRLDNFLKGGGGGI